MNKQGIVHYYTCTLCNEEVTNLESYCYEARDMNICRWCWQNETINYIVTLFEALSENSTAEEFTQMKKHIIHELHECD